MGSVGGPAPLVADLGSRVLRLGFADDPAPRRAVSTAAVAGLPGGAGVGFRPPDFAAAAAAAAEPTIVDGRVVNAELLAQILAEAVASAASAPSFDFDGELFATAGGGPAGGSAPAARNAAAAAAAAAGGCGGGGCGAGASASYHPFPTDAVLTISSAETGAVGRQAHLRPFLECMYEDLGLQTVRLVSPALAAVVAVGRSDGIVVDCGLRSSRVTVVEDGRVLPARGRWLGGGAALTAALRVALREKNVKCVGSSELEYLKHAACFVSLDPRTHRKLARETCCLLRRFRLPDGTEVALERERFEIPETLVANPDDGRTTFHSAFAESVHGIGLDSRLRLIGARGGAGGAVVLAGGGSLLDGLPQRLAAEAQRCYASEILANNRSPRSVAVFVDARPERDLMHFRGTALLATAAAEHLAAPAVTRDRFAECGLRAFATPERY